MFKRGLPVLGLSALAISSQAAVNWATIATDLSTEIDTVGTVAIGVGVGVLLLALGWKLFKRFTH